MSVVDVPISIRLMEPASQGEEVGGTVLGELPLPPLQEIASDPQFLPEEITKEAFETEWIARQIGSKPGLIR